jgi:hypothetical protein
MAMQPGHVGSAKIPVMDRPGRPIGLKTTEHVHHNKVDGLRMLNSSCDAHIMSASPQFGPAEN